MVMQRFGDEPSPDGEQAPVTIGEEETPGGMALFIVCQNHSRNPFVVSTHGTEAEAEKEATTRALLNPGYSFGVLKAVFECCARRQAPILSARHLDILRK